MARFRTSSAPKDYHWHQEDDYADMQALNGLAALWDEPLTYVRQFVEALDSVADGYFLSYFAQKCMPEEWLPLNNEIVWQEAGLTPKQWRRIRLSLIEKGLLLNRRTVSPTGSLFTLNDLLLEKMIKERADKGLISMTASPVSINKLHLQTLAALGCSIKLIIYLSFLQNKTEYQELSQRGDWSLWTEMPEQTVSDGSYLSRREQETAIKQLTDFGVLESRITGLPAMRSCRYSLKRLGDLTLGFMNGGLS